MARLSYGYKYGPISLGGGEGSLLHADLAASAPFVGVGSNQFTLGAIYQFGAGTTQQTYFTLTHNTSGMEIIISAPDGSDATYHSAIHVDKRDSGFNNQQQWSMSYSPGGGFEAQLALSVNPNTLAFWPADSSRCEPLVWAYESQTCDFWFLSDDARAELHVYCRNANRWGFLCMGDELVDNSYDATYIATTFGMMRGYTDTGAPPPDEIVSFRMFYWETAASTSQYTFNYIRNMNILEGAVDGNQPDGNSKFVTSELPLQGLAGFAIWEPTMFRLAGRTNTDTYGLKRGTDINYKFIHLIRDLYLPWDDNVAVP